jgi:hypothetical protein
MNVTNVIGIIKEFKLQTTNVFVKMDIGINLTLNYANLATLNV